MRPETLRARDLRQTMSEAEVMLWSRLKLLRERGFRFRRQAPFRGYFLDFVCYARRLVIEVDGGQHSDDRQSEHDFVRDRVLARHGFRVLRFWAGEIQRDLRSVVERIVAELETQPRTRDEGPDPAPPRSDPRLPTLTASRSVPPH
jgi:very-short-patch-repair endonuclease